MESMSRSLVNSVAYLMSRSLLVPLSMLFMLSAVSASAQKAEEQALFRLEDAFANAVVKRDARALSQIVAKKWVYSDESGVMEREEGIKAFTSGTDTVRTATNADMRAMIYGNAAVVIGVLEMKGRGPKGPFTHRYRYTDAWAKIDGRWRCIGSQDYLMP